MQALGYLCEPGFGIFMSDLIVGVDEIAPAIPQKASLKAYPNPFNSSVSLTAGDVDGVIEIFDIRGMAVALVKMTNGNASWDASKFSSGIYFARLRENTREAIKLVLTK
jgi:hypothetical protein